MNDPYLESTYRHMCETDPRRAAEIAYVLAVCFARKGNLEAARDLGEQSIKLFRDLNIQTLDDSAQRYTILNNVALPDYVNDSVIRSRLEDMGISFH